MRVFPDTNVLASAFGSRGLCADLFRLIISEHELITGEAVLGELRVVLRRKFRVPAQTIDAVEALLRQYHVEPRPRHLPTIDLKDRADLVIIGSALAAHSEAFITGDAELLSVPGRLIGISILSPRQFWEAARRS